MATGLMTFRCQHPDQTAATSRLPAPREELAHLGAQRDPFAIDHDAALTVVVISGAANTKGTADQLYGFMLA